jgi:integrase
LDWSDVDWAVPTLRIRGTKTEASADVVPLTPLAHRELKEWWTRCKEPTAGVIFPSDTGKVYQSSSAYKKPLETAAKRAKLGRDVYPYLLRDSFATIAWTVGIEKDIARRVLRHTDERMLDRVYCRPRPKDMVERLAAFDL